MAQRRPNIGREAYVYIMSNKSHRYGFTARYNFDRLVYFEALPTPSAAAVREKQIKSSRREKRVALIQEKNPRWRDLSANFDDLLMAR